MDIELDKMFEYENKFYLSSTIDRFSKFVTHLDFYRKILGLPGEVVECGVFKANSLSRFIKFRSLLENSMSRKIIAFDTFGEFPEAFYPEDFNKRAEFIKLAGSKSISKGDIENILKDLNLFQNIELVEGDILKTVPEYVKEVPSIKISILHIDVDLYEPTKVVLENFYDHVVKGGIIILDDYGAFAGANKAIDDFFSDKDIKIQKLDFSNSISFVVKI